MDQVGELDGVLDEEDGDVVADQIPVAFLRVNLDGETANVAGQIGRALVAGDRGKPDEGRRLLAGPLEEIRFGVIRQRFICLEIAWAP
jgi:hypothetical protein